MPVGKERGAQTDGKGKCAKEGAAGEDRRDLGESHAAREGRRGRLRGLEEEACSCLHMMPWAVQRSI